MFLSTSDLQWRQSAAQNGGDSGKTTVKFNANEESNMSASQSFLSSPDYGYDYVVAVTQASINATAQAFLNSQRPVINVCYIYDDKGDPELIDYEALKQKAKGADPFAIPENGPQRETQLKALDEAGFMFGFSAAMGLPDGFEPATLPDIVTFGATAEAPLTYCLLCKHFRLAELKSIPHKPSVFQSFAQPTGPTGPIDPKDPTGPQREPWIFAYKIRLKNTVVKDNRAFMEGPAFANLPAAVRDKITAKPEDFTISHLLYDFIEAARDTEPVITGVDRILKQKLNEDFAIRYFNEMQRAGAPVLSVAPAHNDPLAGMTTGFSINPSPTAPKLATLNYLCTLAGHVQPAPKPFAWNWVEPVQAGQFDGVCVINKKDFVEHLRQQLDPYFKLNRYVPHPVIIETYGLTYLRRFGVVPMGFDWKGKQPPELKIREQFTAPDTGPLVLSWNFDASREYDYASGTSWMLGDTSFSLKVSVAGNSVTIEQHALVYCKMVIVTFSRHEWNLVDLTITDTFTLATGHDGRLSVEHATATKDDSATIESFSWVFPDMKDKFTDTQTKARSKMQSRLVNFPLDLMDGIFFPGNKSFLFKEIGFSEHQDLVAHITYADPT